MKYSIRAGGYFLAVTAWLLLGLTGRAAAAASQEKQAILDFRTCIEGIADYVHGVPSGGERVRRRCRLARFFGTPLRKSLFGGIEDLQGILKKLDRPTRERCRQVWIERIRHAISVAQGSAASQVPSKAAHEAAGAASEAELEALIRIRSLTDQELTRAAMEDGSGYGRFDGKDCTFPVLLIVAVRAENVAFLLDEHMLDLYAAGILSRDVLDPLWFMLQHADLHPWFQQKWAAVLEKTGKERGFPERRVQALVERAGLGKRRSGDTP